jgi:hypothetical protein
MRRFLVVAGLWALTASACAEGRSSSGSGTTGGDGGAGGATGASTDAASGTQGSGGGATGTGGMPFPGNASAGTGATGSTSTGTTSSTGSGVGGCGAMSSTTACVECCDDFYPDEFIEFAVYLIQNCACDPAGACWEECNDPMENFCMDLSADPTKCETCLGALGNVPCVNTTTMDCTADPACKPAIDCIATCPMP